MTTRDSSVLVLLAAAAGLQAPFLVAAAFAAQLFWVGALALHTGRCGGRSELQRDVNPCRCSAPPPSSRATMADGAPPDGQSAALIASIIMRRRPKRAPVECEHQARQCRDLGLAVLLGQRRRCAIGRAHDDVGELSVQGARAPARQRRR